MIFNQIFSPLLAILIALNVADAAFRGVANDFVDNTAGDVDRALHPKAIGRRLNGKSESKKSKKMKMKKKKKSEAPSSAPSSVPTSFLQPDYDFGMFKEIEGFWVGEEKFANEECGGPFDYCSTAIFDPRGEVEPENFLIFQSAFIGETGSSSCLADAGVNPVTGDINSNWFRKVDPFNYILQIEQKECLAKEECTYDVVEQSGFFDDYTILEQSCGSHLKVDRTTGLNNCELFQVNLLEENTTKDLLVVNVLSYSGGVAGYGNIVCPIEPTFSLDTLASDENMDGILLFVKQGCIGENCTVTSTDDWECTI